jgi:hypothetical protein
MLPPEDKGVVREKSEGQGGKGEKDKVTIKQ